MAAKPNLSLTMVGSGYLGPALHKSEDVTALARKILDMYDKDKTGHLGHTEIANILMDMYRSFNKSINPSKTDVDTFSRVMDMNKDGRITQTDLEACIRRFLTCEVEIIKNVTSISSVTTSSTLPIGASRMNFIKSTIQNN